MLPTNTTQPNLLCLIKMATAEKQTNKGDVATFVAFNSLLAFEELLAQNTGFGTTLEKLALKRSL